MTVCGLLAGAAIGAGAIYAATCLGLFAALMVGAASGIGRHHPFPRFGPANTVTMGRAMLVALSAGLIGEPPRAAGAWLGVGVVPVMAILDGVDGWLARRARMASVFGARFDMEIDAVFILVLSILVWRHDKAGAWVLGCGLMRYGFVAAGWLLPRLARPLRSTRRGKTVAILQFVGLGVALAPPVPVPASTLAAAIALTTLAWSFAVDISWLWRQRGAA
jgi:phosphatidylglycerophosphate synthase